MNQDSLHSDARGESDGGSLPKEVSSARCSDAGWETKSITPHYRHKDPRHYHNHCWYCGHRLCKPDVRPTSRDRTVDHVVPVCKGGKRVSANVVPSCFRCNQKKRDMSLEEFRNCALGGKRTFYGEKLEVLYRMVK